MGANPGSGVYEPALIQHYTNIAGYLDQMITDEGVDMFVLIEVCDCGTLEQVITEMAHPKKGHYLPYIIDQQAHMKIGIISRLDPVKGSSDYDRTPVYKTVDNALVPRAMETKFPLWGKNLYLYGAHFKASTKVTSQRQRHMQANAIIEEYKKKDVDGTDVIIVTGDFNSEFDLVYDPYEKDHQFSKEAIDPFKVANNILEYTGRDDVQCELTIQFNVDKYKVQADSCGNYNDWYAFALMRRNSSNVVTNYAQATGHANIKAGLDAVANDDPFTRLTMKNLGNTKQKVFNNANYTDWPSKVKYTGKKQCHLTLAKKNNELVVVGGTCERVSETIYAKVGAVKQGPAFVPATDYNDAVGKIRALLPTRGFHIKFTRETKPPYALFTAPSAGLVSVTPPLGTMDDMNPNVNTHYTHLRCREPLAVRNRNKAFDMVIDYFFVSPLIKSKTNPVVKYKHTVGKQCGKYSDHEPVIMTLTKPDPDDWSAHIDYNNIYDEYTENINSLPHDYQNKHQHANEYYAHNQSVLLNNTSSLLWIEFIVILVILFLFCCVCMMVGGICGFVMKLMIASKRKTTTPAYNIVVDEEP
eukprot:243319_1